ncbi:MAG TPA: OadG family transporter subunit [Prolixibacteraceae bacterium]|nr:OadG family transporter subunit [Prolixibacteraceae bacterium]
MILLSVNWGNALVISLVGFLIVFLLLVFLVGVVSLFEIISLKAQATTDKNLIEKKESESSDKNVADGEYAAISLALHLYMNYHDEESNIITLKNIDRRYSPWSSKIYGINEI